MQNERRRYAKFKPRLIRLIQSQKAAERERERRLREKYDSLYATWQSRLERFENLPKRKDRQTRRRELYERQFAELRKQREDSDRLDRLLAGRSPDQFLATLPIGAPSSPGSAESEFVQLINELNEKLVSLACWLATRTNKPSTDICLCCTLFTLCVLHERTVSDALLLFIGTFSGIVIARAHEGETKDL